MTSVPLTLPAAGKASASPAGQCDTMPGLGQKPHTPPTTACLSPCFRFTRRSVPAADVTCICCAPRSFFMAARTTPSSAGSGTVRSRISGCSLDTMSRRGMWPSTPFMIVGSSGACSRPSTVQSTTMSARANATTTGPSCPMASLAPVERTGAGAVNAGVVSVTSNTLAPMPSSARRASSTFTRRDCVSAKMATTSPGCTLHRVKVRTNAASHLCSIFSTNMFAS